MTSEKNTIIIRGKLVKGLGVGGKYVSHPYYSFKFREILGCDPYPGTLNIDSDTDWRELASHCRPLVIESTNWNGVELGAVYVWRARVQGVDNDKITLIRPLKSRHKPQVLELVACIELKPVIPSLDNIIIEIECIKDPYILLGGQEAKREK
ncbi:MAG: DUF120 domain-containing protein [Pyrodictiaceae archaeon]